MISCAFEKFGGAFAIDGWSDKFKKNHYFGVTVHYISRENGELVMNDRTLLIRQLDDVEKKDGEYVRKKIEEYLLEFGLMAHVGKITFITDRGTNMVASLRIYNHIHCFCHMINNVVQHMLEKLDCIQAASAIVRYFKITGQNGLFSTSLKSNVSTRWNSVDYMVESILKHYQMIESILRAKKLHLNDLAKIPYDQLEVLHEFLKKFTLASEKLEGSHYPTLHCVYPYYEEIREHLSPRITDCEFIAELKRKGLIYWIGNVGPNVTELHDVATFLHPQMKGLKTHTSSRKRQTYAAVSVMLEELGADNFTATARNYRTDETSSAMRRFLDADSDAETNELEEYKELKVRSITGLLQWWDDHKTFFPNLFQIACRIHAIPASSSSAERIFSTAGRMCSYRPNLRAEKMDDIMFLRSNYDLLKKNKIIRDSHAQGVSRETHTQNDNAQSEESEIDEDQCDGDSGNEYLSD